MLISTLTIFCLLSYPNSVCELSFLYRRSVIFPCQTGRSETLQFWFRWCKCEYLCIIRIVGREECTVLRSPVCVYEWRWMKKSLTPLSLTLLHGLLYTQIPWKREHTIIWWSTPALNRTSVVWAYSAYLLFSNPYSWFCMTIQPGL